MSTVIGHADEPLIGVVASAVAGDEATDLPVVAFTNPVFRLSPRFPTFMGSSAASEALFRRETMDLMNDLCDEGMGPQTAVY